jgi:Sec-independent protein translocase protein TatA
LPQMARNLGKAMRDFQNMTQNAKSEIHRILEEEDKNQSDSKKDLKG